MSGHSQENSPETTFDESENLIHEIDTILTEGDRANAEIRWRTKINYIMSTIGRAVAQFSIAKIMSNDLSKYQSYIHQVFRRSDYIGKIKKDKDMQNVYLLGYFHAVDELCLQIKALEDPDKDGTLTSIIRSYKHTAPVLFALDEHIELSHKELASRIGISATALSNYMSKVRPHSLFNVSRIGKHQYYTIAKPNGANALEAAKRSKQPYIDVYTDLLLKLLETLQDVAQHDEYDENYVSKRCDALISKYTSSPAVCKKQIKTLAHLLMSERITADKLSMLEMEIAKKSVTVFTRVFDREVLFLSSVYHKLKQGVEYHWYVVRTEKFNAETSTKDYLIAKFDESGLLLSDELNSRISITILMPEDARQFFGKTVDAVIYDNQVAYSCTDESVEMETPYHRMSQEEKRKFLNYRKSLA